MNPESDTMANVNSTILISSAFRSSSDKIYYIGKMISNLTTILVVNRGKAPWNTLKEGKPLRTPAPLEVYEITVYELT